MINTPITSAINAPRPIASRTPSSAPTVPIEGALPRPALNTGCRPNRAVSTNASNVKIHGPRVVPSFMNSVRTWIGIADNRFFIGFKKRLPAGRGAARRSMPPGHN